MHNRKLRGSAMITSYFMYAIWKTTNSLRKWLKETWFMLLFNFIKQCIYIQCRTCNRKQKLLCIYATRIFRYRDTPTPESTGLINIRVIQRQRGKTANKQKSFFSALLLLFFLRNLNVRYRPWFSSFGFVSVCLMYKLYLNRFN